MVKATRIDSPKADDPIFKQPPTISVPVSKPSTTSLPADSMRPAADAIEAALTRALKGSSNVAGMNLDELKKQEPIRRGTTEASLMDQIEKGLLPHRPKDK